jgi:hypothetical protein
MYDPSKPLKFGESSEPGAPEMNITMCIYCARRYPTPNEMPKCEAFPEGIPRDIRQVQSTKEPEPPIRSPALSLALEGQLQRPINRWRKP